MSWQLLLIARLPDVRAADAAVVAPAYLGIAVAAYMKKKT